MQTHNFNIVHKIIIIILLTILSLCFLFFQIKKAYPLFTTLLNQKNLDTNYNLLKLQKKNLLSEIKSYSNFCEKIINKKTYVTENDIRELTVNLNGNINIKQLILKTDNVDNKKDSLTKIITIDIVGQYKPVIEFANMLETKYNNITVTKLSFTKKDEDTVNCVLVIEVKDKL